MPVEHFCLSCSKTFTTFLRLRSHSRGTSHIPNPYICEGCNLSFSSSVALQSHMNSSKHLYDYPPSHPTAFLDGLNGRYSGSGGCLEVSDSDDDSNPYCDGCERQFINTPALNQHLAYSSKHNWCFDCSRDFRYETSLGKHRTSRAHRGRDFKCPFCKSMFKRPSGIVLHIESGCHKFTRHHVTAAVHALQITPNISTKRITGPIRPPTLHPYIASEASFTGSAYGCFLCHRVFRTLSGLNGHFNSPAHDADEFRCPKCKTEFKLVSRFVQHLENGSCGLAKSTQIDNYFDDITGQFSHLLSRRKRGGGRWVNIATGC